MVATNFGEVSKNNKSFNEAKRGCNVISITCNASEALPVATELRWEPIHESSLTCVATKNSLDDRAGVNLSRKIRSNGNPYLNIKLIFLKTQLYSIWIVMRIPLDSQSLSDYEAKNEIIL